MNISVLITSYNRRPLFGRTWSTLKGQLKPGDELVVVEEGSDQNWHNYLEELGVDFQFYFTNNKKYRSCSIAKNIALKKAKNDLILINDPEVMHITPCIDPMRGRLKTNPRQFIVPGFLYEEQRPGQSIDKCAVREHSMAPFVGMVLKEELMKVNGWDERFKYWGNDDNDLMYRLGLNGCEHIVMDELKILHQYHERPPKYAIGDYNHKVLNEETKKIIANEGVEWGKI